MEKAKAFMEQRQNYGAKTRNGQTINFVAAETGKAAVSTASPLAASTSKTIVRL